MSEEYPVLIIGGGVVGLTTALFLERCGLRALLVERHPGTSIHPRARGVNGRTMELMRELGLEQQVRSAGEKLAPAVGLFSGHNLKAVLEARGEGGFLLKRMRKRGLRGDATRNSPCGPSRCPQDELEPVLLTAARARGVEVRLFTELESLEQVEGEVRCTILDRSTGLRRCVRARYVIAADGARSKTRERLGIGRSGEARGTHQMNLYFRADLRELVRGREFSMCLIEQPGMRGLFTSIDNAEHWVLHVSYDPERGERPEDFVPERCIALIRAAAGVPELEVQLKGVLPWESATRIADRYRDGRVFLAGDAAHVMPPWGGFGANTGIQDGHNLAWKLAAVLGGTAGERLLDSYQAERRPVALDVGAIAASMNDTRGLMQLKRSLPSMLWTMRKIFPYLGVGYGYSSEAIAAEGGRTVGPGSDDLKGRPGTRAAHVWLEPSAYTTARLAALGREPSANGKLSSLDLVGREYVLFAGLDAAAWCDAAQRTASGLGVALHVVRIGSDVHDRARKLRRAYGIGSAGASLIRPDGFVAWRASRAPRSAAAAREEIDRVLRRTLARDEMPVIARAS